jgi:hypothetical protein
MRMRGRRAARRRSCSTFQGGFYRSGVNLTVIKSGVADLTGLGKGDGGADFSEVSLSYVKSPGSIRSKSAEGVAALASWCAGGGRSDVMPGTSSLREGAPTS